LGANPVVNVDITVCITRMTNKSNHLLMYTRVSLNSSSVG
jgi:hypothetical protein